MTWVVPSSPSWDSVTPKSKRNARAVVRSAGVSQVLAGTAPVVPKVHIAMQWQRWKHMLLALWRVAGMMCSAPTRAVCSRIQSYSAMCSVTSTPSSLRRADGTLRPDERAAVTGSSGEAASLRPLASGRKAARYVAGRPSYALIKKRSFGLRDGLGPYRKV